MKQQVAVIHGGDTFDTKDEYLAFLREFEVEGLDHLRRKGWKSELETALGEGFDVLRFAMPNKSDAKYSEWKMWFEKFIPFLDDGIVFIGHSLGGIFLAKYLSEESFPKKVRATFLIAPPFDDADADFSLADFRLSGDLEGLARQGGDVSVWHSEDDPVVPFADSKKYAHLLPRASIRVFKDRGHFGQDEFPELTDAVKRISSA